MQNKTKTGSASLGVRLAKDVDGEPMMNKLIAALREIPKGEVRSYKDIALAIGTGPRVVAKLISKNPYPITVPCHRVIRHNGEVGGYTPKGKMDPAKKISLLKKEGVNIVKGRVVGFAHS